MSVNIKKLYKTAGKCDGQQQYKAMLEAEIVSTPERFTNHSTMTPNPYLSKKQISARK